MEKRSFIPFDAKTFLMIEDVTGTEPEVTEKENYFELKMYAPDKEERIIEAAIYAVQGRYGKRIKDVRTIKEQNLLRGAIFFVEYEKGAGNLPNELRINLGMPDETAGDIYCRRLLEVRALPVKRDNWENNDESELREKWRLHDSDVEGQRSTRRDSNEVRNDAGNLSQGESERNLFSYAPEGDIERTSVNDPEPGRRTDGDFDPADGKESI